MKRLILALAVVLLSLTAAQAKPATTVNIAGPYGDATYQKTVWFHITWDNVNGNNWPMMYVSCFKDNNNDGVIDTSGVWNVDGVYGDLSGPGNGVKPSGEMDIYFLLGGGSSEWVTQGGGPAKCKAQAYTYGWKGQYEVIYSYGDPIYFDAAG